MQPVRRIVITVMPNEEVTAQAVAQGRPSLTGADWYFDNGGDLHVHVAEMSDPLYELLLGVHETIEALACRHDGVSHARVDAFDADYDAHHPTNLNAGDNPECPYRNQHNLATGIERVLAAHWKVDWTPDDRELEKL